MRMNLNSSGPRQRQQPQLRLTSSTRPAPTRRGGDRQLDGRPALTPSAGEIWLADRGDERRRLVFVLSDDRFQRLAEHAVVAPVLDEIPEAPRPWHIPVLGDRAIAVNQLGTVPLDRLLGASAKLRTRRSARCDTQSERSQADRRELHDRSAVHLAEWVADQLQPLAVGPVEIER